MPGRGYDAETYPFGFGGKETDNEVKDKGNQIVFENRVYDPRIGKWLSIDPATDVYASWSPYNYVRDNPILRVDHEGLWDITVHVYSDRKKYGYGIAIVTDKYGKEVYRMKVRVEGTGGHNRMVEKSDTPLGVYDIPDKLTWGSGGDRGSYGPNPRHNLNGESGEIIESKRDLIRVHGGRQEIYNEESGKWEKVKNPELKKTFGCLRANDAEIKELKSITDKLQKNDSKEFGGKLKVVDDLVEKNGNYVLPEIQKNDKKAPEIKLFIDPRSQMIDKTYVKHSVIIPYKKEKLR